MFQIRWWLYFVDISGRNVLLSAWSVPAHRTLRGRILLSSRINQPELYWVSGIVLVLCCLCGSITLWCWSVNIWPVSLFPKIMIVTDIGDPLSFHVMVCYNSCQNFLMSTRKTKFSLAACHNMYWAKSCSSGMNPFLVWLLISFHPTTPSALYTRYHTFGFIFMVPWWWIAFLLAAPSSLIFHWYTKKIRIKIINFCDFMTLPNHTSYTSDKALTIW